MPAITLKGKAGPPTTRKDGSVVVVSKAVTAVLEERFPRTAMKGKQAQSVSAIELHAALNKERQTVQTLVSKQANEMMAGQEKKAAAKLKAALKETSDYMNKQASTAVAAEEKKAAAAIKTLKGKVVAKNKQTEAIKATKATEETKHKKEMQAVIDKAATATAKAKDDTAKALALSTIQEKDLAKVTAERDTLQARRDKRDTHKATKKTKAAAATAATAAERAERRRIRAAQSSSSGSEDSGQPASGSGIVRIPATPRITGTPTAAPRTPAKRGRSMSMAPTR
jgi:membrane protein involved in colicin uptake